MVKEWDRDKLKQDAVPVKAPAKRKSKDGGMYLAPVAAAGFLATHLRVSWMFLN